MLMSIVVIVLGIYALSSNDIKVGTNIEVDGAPWRVLGIFRFFWFSSSIYLFFLKIFC